MEMYWFTLIRRKVIYEARVNMAVKKFRYIGRKSQVFMLNHIASRAMVPLCAVTTDFIFVAKSKIL